ncbi:MAG: hypothetical protein LBI10_04385, partial [Deltaproteobacteria bacterium]|nr:hypothetical protein [Deltaproteobacteria bacterium]
MAKIFGFLVIWALGFLVLATTPSYAQEDYISPDLEKPKGLPNPGSLNATPTWPAPLPKGLKMPEALDPKTVLAAFMG